ncbi:MAG: trypsin-like peptidase domain-containing protein [Verrucomicrobiae bacterium]
MLPRAASKLLAAAALAAFAVPCGEGNGLRAEDPEGKIQPAIALNVFEARRSAVVKVRAKDRLGIRFGSGFFADPTGLVYTHAGIVMRADEVAVLTCGKELPAQVLVVDERSGIAILKVDASTPSIPIGDSQKVFVGTPLMLIGYPEDLGVSVGFGAVSCFDRKILDKYFSTTHIRADISVERGQGGSPVMTLQGEAIGILVGSLDSGAACRVLPMRAAEKVRADLARFGEPRPGWVGVEVADAAEPVSGSAAIVGALDPETPAAQSGLKPGDTLLQVGATPITSSEDVIDAAYFLTAGESTEIQVQRGAEKLSIEVRPVLHPHARRQDMQATVLPDAKIHLE